MPVDVVRRSDPSAVTVGPSHEDEGYARTREFYLATGLVAMTEVQRIDWSGPTLILVKTL